MVSIRVTADRAIEQVVSKDDFLVKNLEMPVVSTVVTKVVLVVVIGFVVSVEIVAFVVVVHQAG